MMGLYAAFWRLRKPLLGVLLVLLLGSDPFQVFEVYRNNNVLGWPRDGRCLLEAGFHGLVPRLRSRWPRLSNRR